MHKRIVGPLLVLIAAQMNVQGAVVPKRATAAQTAKASTQAWKTSLKSAVPTLIFSRAGSPPLAHYPAPLYTIDSLHAIRNQNPVAFDRRYPDIGKILILDDRLRAAMAQCSGSLNGLLPATAANHYLHYRRSLDPARFDYFHPVLGAILAEDDALRTKTNPCPAPGEVIPPPPPTTPPPTNVPPGTPNPKPPIGEGGGGTPPPTSGGKAVPEPTGLVLLLIGLSAMGVCHGIRTRARARQLAIAST